MGAETIIHLSGEKGESGTEKRSNDSGRGESRSRRPEIHINNIVEQTDKHAQYTDADQTASQNGTNPVDGRVTCPAKPEHGDDQGKARDDAKLETFFGLWGVGSNFLGVALVPRFDDGEEKENGNATTGEETQERKTFLTGIESVVLYKDKGISFKQKID